MQDCLLALDRPEDLHTFFLGQMACLAAGYLSLAPCRRCAYGLLRSVAAAAMLFPALLFIAVTAGLMTVAKNHISQGANEPTNSYGNASPSDPNQADPEPTSTVYRMDERPGYESMVTYVTDKLDHYKDEILNNNTTMFMSEYPTRRTAPTT